jgi:DNA-binding MarR family transcriptional regulator
MDVMKKPSTRDTSDLQLGMLSGLVGYRLRLLQIAAFRDFEERTFGFGSAPRYFGLLSIIEKNPGSQQSHLAETIFLVKSSLVPILDKLEAANLVERRASSSDRRAKGVWITPQGRKVLERLRPLVLEHESKLMQGFPAADRKKFAAFLKRATENLGARDSVAAAA